MRKLVILFCFFLFTHQSFGWGVVGHRIIGLIAEQHLSKKARKNIRQVLGTETLAEVANYMDFIKSDPNFRHLSPWHYATIPDGRIYEQAGPPEEGDIISAILKLQEEIKTGNFKTGDEAFVLKCLIHLVGDIHQPLHVGNGQDRGGNDIRLEYFGESANLHRVWDTGIIDGQQYSYTEYVNWINHPTAEQLEQWSSLNVMDWANESKDYRDQAYDTMPEDKRLSYRYDFDNVELVNQRLLQAGIRLANLLNELYG